MTRGTIAAAALLLLSAASAALGQEFTRPPYAGIYEPQGVDERGLWMQMDEEERGLRTSPTLLGDAALTGYIHGVLCKTVGEERCRSVRVYVVKDRDFNAAMAPNGLMFVHTGLLARLHSEAELAAVLGHEFAHFELRHSLNGFRKRRSTQDAIAWISLAGAAARTNMTSLSNSLVFSYFSFNRAQESEADAMSVSYLKASSYRLRASRIWQRVVEEDDALRKARGLRKIKRAVPGYLDTHPALLQRISYHQAQETEAGESGEDRADAYRQATSPVLIDLFDPFLKGNDFGAADYIIRARGEALGWDATMLYLHAELFRQRGSPRDLEVASGLFARSVATADAPAESWRGLGLCALRLGRQEEGRAALNRYLAMRPMAEDKAMIELLTGTRP